MTIDTAEIPVRIAGTGDYVPSKPVHSAEFDVRRGKRILELQTNTVRAFPPQRPIVTKLDLTRPYLEAWWGHSPASELPQTRSADLML
jgi:hypothetical protein